jgi:hypothetical protein
MTPPLVPHCFDGKDTVHAVWLIERRDYRTPTEAREHLRAQAATAA